VYVAGAGPVGLAAAASAHLLGAAVVIVGDLNAERLAQARSFGCETVDVSQGSVEEQIAQILGEPEADARSTRSTSKRGPTARTPRRRPPRSSTR
jgi:glutathione-independent formaldehyde dehydrogenase